MSPLPPGHALVITIAGAALTGVVAGLARLGLGVGWFATRAGDHGPLLVLGVFAVVVAQERAAVLGSRWALAAPLGSAIAAIAILAGLSVGPWIAVASNAAMVATNLAIARWRPSRISWQLLAGSGGHVPFSGLFYAPLFLLHATLIVRLAGDLAGVLWMRRIGGVGNALAIALFAVVMASAALGCRDAPL